MAGSNFSDKGPTDFANGGGNGSAKVILVAVAVIAVVAALAYVVVVVWHPWEPTKSPDVVTPMTKTYEAPDETVEPVSPSDAGATETRAVNGWEGVDASTDMHRLDLDEGLLPMDESSEDYARSLMSDEARHLPDGGEVEAFSFDGYPFEPDNSAMGKYAGAGKGKAQRKHRWLEFADIQAHVQQVGSDGKVSLRVEGTAHNSGTVDVGAERLVPVYIDGKPVVARIGAETCRPGESCSFLYTTDELPEEFDLTIYGYTRHVSLRPATEGLAMNDVYNDLAYPLMNQAFVDELGGQLEESSARVRGFAESSAKAGSDGIPVPGVVYLDESKNAK